MSRAGAYGQSFAQKCLAEGRIEEALAEAERQVAADPRDPEPLLDRARILDALGHHEEAVADLRRAIELDRSAQILDDSVVDDTLFSALVAWGRKVATAEPERAVEILHEYGRLMPGGCHRAEAEAWTRRFRGERTLWIKEHDE